MDIKYASIGLASTLHSRMAGSTSDTLPETYSGFATPSK